GPWKRRWRPPALSSSVVKPRPCTTVSSEERDQPSFGPIALGADPSSPGSSARPATGPVIRRNEMQQQSHHPLSASFCRAALFLGVLLVGLAAPPPAAANHIGGPDLDMTRRQWVGQGYLRYVNTGEERTGWTDVRHPALDGTVDNLRGFDWSDNQVIV